MKQQIQRRKHENEEEKKSKRYKRAKEEDSSPRDAEIEIEIQTTNSSKDKSESETPEKPRKLTVDTEESAKKQSPILEQKQVAVELFNSTALSEEIYERDFEKEFLISFLKKSVKGNDSRTLYICGKPGTGKTATLNSALKEIMDCKETIVYFFNGMNYADTKPFLVALNKKICEIAGTCHKEKKGFHEMAGQVHENLKAANSYMYC